MKNKILFVICLLFGLMMMNAGLDKFLHYMPMPTDIPEPMLKAFNAFMAIGWLMPLVGAVELVSGLLFLFPKTRTLGALMILPVMVGIVLCNTVTEPSGAPIALVLFAINIWVLIESRDKLKPIFKS